MKKPFRLFSARLLAAALLAAALMAAFSSVASAWDETQIFVLNVGHGRAVHVQTPEGNFLIDVGPADQLSNLLHHLAENGVANIDAIFLTDLEPGETGALLPLLEQVHAQRIFWSGHRPEKGGADLPWKRLGAFAEIEEMAPGREIRPSRNLSFYAMPMDPDDKEGALVIDVTVKKIGLLFAAAASPARQHELASLEKKRLGRVRWMLWPGEGSEMDHDFVLSLKSLTHAAVSVAPNTPGRPDPQLATWGKAWGVEIARTDTQDSIDYVVADGVQRSFEPR